MREGLCGSEKEGRPAEKKNRRPWKQFLLPQVPILCTIFSEVCFAADDPICLFLNELLWLCSGMILMRERLSFY